MNTTKATLTFNCPENWDKMKIGLVSRYCDNCKRDVQDFTKLTKEEILQFLWTNRNNKVCGRIYKSQLDYHHEQVLLTIDSYIQKNKNSNISFYLLAIGTMLLLGCSTNNNKTNLQTNDSLVYFSNDKNGDLSRQIDSNHACKIDSLLPDEFELVGDIVFDDSLLVDDTTATIYGENGVRILAEVMPEFIGGFDSLFIYIKENLKYPDWERKKEIEGNVFVTFIVDKDGKIQEPRILKSVEGARNFDNEVLRLIKEMPDWKPGQERGQNVAVQFTLPIKFRL